MKNLYLAGILFLFSFSVSFAQEVSDFEDVGSIGKQGFFKNHFKGLFSGFTDGDPFTANGGIGLNARTYSAWGIEDRQPPFYWIMNANLNLKVFQLNIPFSALISINRRDLTRPNAPGLPDIKEKTTNRFNRIGFSPYYKWIKFHFGHRNMNFSQFTLANLTYLGAGAELTPGNVRFAFMYGRLADAEPQDLSLTQPNLPVFRRRGWGTKIGYGNDEDYIDLMLFKAWDDVNSIPSPSPQEVFANENLVMGIKAQKLFFEKFRLSIDYANSALTPDKSDALASGNQFPRPDFLFDARQNTEYKNAVETSVDFLGQGYNLGFKYRRIDPGYKSLGAYFFNNDIVDYSANVSFGLFQQSFQVSGSGGFQQDNLDDTKPSTLTRFIGSLNANYTKDKFNLGLNYSNFSSDIEFVFDPELDSLNVVVVTQDFGADATYRLGKEKGNQHTITLATNVQSVNDDIQDPQQSGESNMFNLNLVYAFLIPQTNWSFTSTLNYNQNELAMLEINRWGMGVGASKNFLENKLSLGANLNFFRATVDAANSITNSTLNWRIRANYRLNDHHVFNVNYAFLHRKKTDYAGTNDTFTEAIGNIGYQFVFAWKPGGKQ